MQPHLVRWQQTFAGQDLVMVYVADGRRVTVDAVAQAMRESGATFPVLHDVQATMTQAYRVQAYPTAYVVGRDGRVVWQGIPHFDPGVPEQAIREALASQ